MSTKKPIASLLKGGLKTILPLTALFVGVTSFMVLKSNKPAPPKPVKREVVQPVRTQEIKLASHQPGLRLYGEVKAGRKVELRALVAGKVLKTGVNFREGSLVRKGDLLLSIDPFSYNGAVVEAKARIVEARARLKEINAQIKAETDSIKYAREQLKLSKRDFDRARKLVARGTVTRQGVEARQIILSQRHQTLDGKQSNLDVLRAKAEQQNAAIDTLQWHLQQAQRNQRDTLLKAPFDGYISTLNANVGKLLNVNDQVALLLDANWMDVVFTLSDRQYGRLLGLSNSGAAGQRKDELIGREIMVTWQLGTTSLRYEAVVERIAAQISSETGGVSVYARLKNPSLPRPVRTGAFVDVSVPDRIYNKVARLPQTALYGRSKVYVVGPQQRLLERQVELRAIDGEHVLVSGELADGERVVVTRMSTIGTGMKVKDLRTSTRPDKKRSPKGSEKISETEKLQRENSWKPTLGGGTPNGLDAKGKQKHRRGGRQFNKNERLNRG